MIVLFNVRSNSHESVLDSRYVRIYIYILTWLLCYVSMSMLIILKNSTGKEARYIHNYVCDGCTVCVILNPHRKRWLSCCNLVIFVAWVTSVCVFWLCIILFKYVPPSCNHQTWGVYSTKFNCVSSSPHAAQSSCFLVHSAISII